MSGTNFSPRSIQQQERDITRRQRDFSEGMFLDGPSYRVPENGVRELKNFVNKGWYLEGRGGCRRWSDSKLPNLKTVAGVERNYYTATKSGNVITVTDGGDFTSSDIGNYFVWKDGVSTGIDRHYRIIAVGGTGSITVNDSDDDIAIAQANCACRGPVNALYVHETLSKIIMLIDRRVFTSDIAVTSWEQAYTISQEIPQDSPSEIVEYENYAFLINANGIYKIDLEKTVTYVFKTNSSVPRVKLISQGTATETTPYCRRYVYSMSRLSGTGSRDRTTPGVNIECESATVVYNPDTKDFAAVCADDEIDTDNGVTIGILTNPYDGEVVKTIGERHWTHYSVYATLDVGNLGFDPVNGKANQSELYIWLADIPVAKAVELHVLADGTFIATMGTVEDLDVGCVITSVDGILLELATVITSTTGTIVDIGGSTYSGGAFLSAFNIGSTDSFRFTQSGKVVNLTSGSLTLTVDDIGKPLFCSNGATKYITSIISTGSVKVADSATISSPVVAAFNASTRNFRDTVSDTTLRARIRAWPLKQRAWDPLPRSNAGAIGSNFLFVARREEEKIYYSEFPQGYEHLVGYYNSLDQVITFDDGIIQLKMHRESLIVTCLHSTHEVDSTNFTQEIIDDIGETHAIISSKNVIDPNIGCMDWGGNTFMDEDTEMIITSEPEIRTFTGRNYGEGLAKDRIAEVLRSMQTAYNAGYSRNLGYIFWGSIENG